MEKTSENGDWQPICGVCSANSVCGSNSVPVHRFRGTAYNTLKFKPLGTGTYISRLKPPRIPTHGIRAGYFS